MKCQRCGDELAYCARGWPHCDCDLIEALTLTITQTARYLCVSRTQVYRLIAWGLLPGGRDQGRIRIPLVSIKAMLAADHLAWLQERATA
jgi:excisionase family DNA binding protein